MWSRTQKEAKRIKMQGSPLPVGNPGQWSGTTSTGSIQSWHPALSRRTLTRSWSLWAVRVQILVASHALGVRGLGSGYWPDPGCLFIWFRWAPSGPGPRGATKGSEERAVWKARELWFFSSASLAGWMRWSWPSWNCRVDFPVVFHCWRSHRHTGPLQHCLPPTVWSRWPVCHFVSPPALSTAMFLQKELGCSPLVGIQGNLFVRICGDAKRTLLDNCAVSCF